jgi:hypothetical protein
VVNEVLKKYGITPPSTTQTVLQGAGSALGAGADAAAANRSAGVDGAALAERLNLARQFQCRDEVLARESTTVTSTIRTPESVREQEAHPLGEDSLTRAERSYARRCRLAAIDAELPREQAPEVDL